MLSIPASAFPTLVVVCALVGVVLASVLSQSVGALLDEVGFPVLAVWILTRKTTDRFEPSTVFPAGYLIWYWIGSIPIIESHNSILTLLDPFSDIQWFLYLLGFIAFWCGSLLFKRTDRRPSALGAQSLKWHRTLTLFMFSLLAFIVIAAWGSITISEGIPVFKGDIDAVRVELPTRHHIAYQLMVAASDVALPLIFAYLWTDRAPQYKKTLYSFSIFIVFVFISMGNRGLVLPSVLTILILRHYLLRPWKTTHIIVASISGLSLVSISGYYRNLQHFGPGYALDLIKMGIPLPLQPFTNIYLYVRAPLDTFRNITRLIPQAVAFQHGSLSFGFILQLFPGRHPSSDFFFKEILGHTFEGFGEPASILGTFYGDYGVVGIILGMFLTGLLARFVYNQTFTGSLAWLMVYCFFLQKLISSLYGSLFTYVIEVLLPLTWLIVVTILARRITNSAGGTFSEHAI